MKNEYYVRVHRALWPFVHLIHPVEVTGLENLPEDEPVLLCANHSSWWDPVLLVSGLRREYPLRIMGKVQLFRVPVLKTFLTKMGVFPVDRGNSDIGALKLAIGGLKDGWNLLLFPEGTRVRKGRSVQPKAGAAMIAIRSGVRLTPVYIGTRKPLFGKVPIVIGKPYQPVYSGRKGTAEEYQANVDEIMRQVYELGGAI